MQTVERFSKIEALNAVVRVYRGGQLDTMELEHLINFLLPPLPSKPRNAWDFVARAVPTWDLRSYMNYVHVIDGTAYATDGSRMHYSAVDRDNGVYTKKGELEADNGPLIKSASLFKNVIPRCTHRYWSLIKYDVELFGHNYGTRRVAKIDGMGVPYRINLQYLLDATACDPTAQYVISDYRDDQICVQHKLGAAVVMGLRV